MPKKQDIDTLMKNLEERITAAASKALSDEVFPLVRDMMQGNIEADVYGAYTPARYKRRYDNGGMIDPRNIQGTMSDDGLSLTIQNVTPPNPANGTTDKDLPTVIELGDKWGYDYYPSKRNEYAEPRPFTYDTFMDVDKTRRNEITSILAKAMKHVKL